MIRLLLLALALAVSVDGPGDHTVWEDEDAAREAALDEAGILDDESATEVDDDSSPG